MSSSFQCSGPAIPAEQAVNRLRVQGSDVRINIHHACGFLARLRGWLGLRKAPENAGLLLSPCDAVHTFAMRFSIDIVFIDAEGRVLIVDRHVPAWRVRVCLGAQSVIELPAGWASRLGIQTGVRLEIGG